MPSPYAAYSVPAPIVQYAAPYVTPAAGGIDFSMWPQYDPLTGATYTYRDLGLNYQENSAPETKETVPEPLAAQQAAPEAEDRAQQQPEQHQQQPEQHQQQPEQHQQQPEPEEQYEVPPTEPQYAEPQYAEPQYAEPQYAEAQAVAPTEGQVPVSKK